MESLQHENSDTDVPIAEGKAKLLKRKVGRPIMDEGDPLSPDMTPEQRRVMLRRVANRESARRVRDRRNEDMNRLVLKADCLKTKNALLREELNRAQALESQLKGQLAQVQKDTAAMDQSNADMRTTVACLRQRGAPLQPPGSPIGTMLPLPSSFRYCIDFLVQPDTPYEASWLDTRIPFARDGEWLGSWDTLIEDLTLESVPAAPDKGHPLP